MSRRRTMLRVYQKGLKMSGILSLTEGYPGPVAGAGLSGAPPTETGPKGLGSAAIVFLRTTRAR